MALEFENERLLRTTCRIDGEWRDMPVIALVAERHEYGIDE